MNAPERKLMAVSSAPPAEDPAHYFSRETSWLAFNERVLEEAADPRWPLLERLKFFAIFHSNLDEFFMIRVSGLHEQLGQPVAPGPDGLSAREQLDQIHLIAGRQLRTAAELWSGQLYPQLEAANIRLRTWDSLSADERRRARTYFRSTVFPVLTPLAVDPGHPFPFISNLSLSLAVEAEDPETGVRLEVDPRTPERIRELLLGKLQIDREDLYETPAPLGAASLMALYGLPRPELHDPPFAAQHSHPMVDGDPFAAIRAGDVLLHHPYDSFAPVLSFLRRAAEDPDVLAIKLTLYRTGANSEIGSCLVRAAENGKQVAIAIELKARFDEQNNIEWARALERAGAHVFYGSAGLKIHAKAALVVRREQDKIRRYVHLSTGNYNASTSRIYTDLSLFTCDEELGEDVSELFNSLSGFSKSANYRQLAVAPASIDLNVRGICCLRPGLPGHSENIRVFSVVGRFLEHSRLLVVGPEGEDEVMSAVQRQTLRVAPRQTKRSPR